MTTSSLTKDVVKAIGSKLGGDSLSVLAEAGVGKLLKIYEL